MTGAELRRVRIQRTVRFQVVPACEPRCPSCMACPQGGQPATVEGVLADERPDMLILGGDATRWAALDELLEANARRSAPAAIWIEAPAARLSLPALEGLVARGVSGVRVQVEGAGERMLALLGVGDGERAVADAEQVGLGVQVLLCARPKSLPALVGVAQRLAPRVVDLELIRKNWGEPAMPILPEAVERAFDAAKNLRFTALRMPHRGYLPACTLPALWRERPSVWRSTFSERPTPTAVLPVCADCGLATMCQWNDPEALAPDVRAALRPVRGDPKSRSSGAVQHRPVPTAIVARRTEPAVICTTPWTTMEIVDPDGRVRQCCSTWTRGDRGNANTTSLTDVWNGPGYQAARRAMATGAPDELCQPICSRLYDQKFGERALRIMDGSERFVNNQLLLAEEIAQRKEKLSARPLRMAVCPSTYCNYDCIMCEYGRSPRHDLSDALWEEIPEFLPTLQTLTLLGGEPLADQRVMKLLQEFDVARYPDARIDVVTNGSLLTEAALTRMTSCTLGDVTVSLNAGTAAVYERVQRGIAFDRVLANVDALIRFRDSHHTWFGITLSFVIQSASADSIVDFAELAHARDVPIRLLPVTPDNIAEVDFYVDGEQVERVLQRVDELAEFCARVRPEWLQEVDAARSAIAQEAAGRQRAAGGRLKVLR